MSEPPEKNPGNSSRPKTLFDVLPSAFVCATIAFIAYLIATSHSEPPPRVWMPVLAETNGQATILGDTRQMQFWTPSAKTKDYLTKEGGAYAGNEKWEVLANEDTVLQFGVLLRSNLNVLGYRRVEEWGQGRTATKPGWWWTLNVHTNCSANDVAHFYQSYWKPPRPVFIEVTDNRGSIGE